MKKIFLTLLLIAITCGFNGCSSSPTNSFNVGDYVAVRDGYDTLSLSNGVEMPGILSGYGFIFGIRQIIAISVRPSTGEPIARLDGSYTRYWFTVDSLYHVSPENVQQARQPAPIKTFNDLTKPPNPL